MKHIKPSANEHGFPRHAVKSVETRKRDLVIRITDWTRDRDEPAFDVETYVGGVYDYNLSKCCSFHTHGTKAKARTAAVAFAQNQIAAIL